MAAAAATHLLELVQACRLLQCPRLHSPPPHCYTQLPAGRTVLEVLQDFKSAQLPLEWLLQVGVGEMAAGG